MPGYNKQQTQTQQCSWHECQEMGEYPAPKHTDNTNHYQWFCLEHIREFNASWDYFANKSEDEIRDFHQNTLYGHRHTKPAGFSASKATEAIEQELNRLFGCNDDVQMPSSIPKDIAKALASLELSYPIGWEDIKTQYKILVKQHHPDVNQGNKQAEERFKAISHAYHILQESNYFT